MKILNNKDINQKTRRLAYQILEQNTEVKKLVFLGINNNGSVFAKLLKEQYESISSKEVSLGSISLNPADPLESEIALDTEVKNLKGKHLIVIDDVANTGRTLFYAMKPLMEYVPNKIEVAVLVDRKHKSFPIQVDYVGLSLATTLKENIVVEIKKESSKAAFLQ